MAMPGLNNLADQIGERPGQQPLLVLDHGNVASTFRRGAGSLETDNAAANDDDAGLTMERLTQLYRILDAAKVVNPRTCSSLKRRNPPRLGAGREQQPVIFERPAVAGRYGLALCIAGDDSGSGNHADVEHIPPVARRLEIGDWRIRRREQFL